MRSADFIAPRLAIQLALIAAARDAINRDQAGEGPIGQISQRLGLLKSTLSEA